MKNKKNIDNINNKNNISDSRITNQDKYLHGRTMKKYTFEKQGNRDHEHCAFCWKKSFPVWKNTLRKTELTGFAKLVLKTLRTNLVGN